MRGGRARTARAGRVRCALRRRPVRASSRRPSCARARGARGRRGGETPPGSTVNFTHVHKYKMSAVFFRYIVIVDLQYPALWGKPGRFPTPAGTFARPRTSAPPPPHCAPHGTGRPHRDRPARGAPLTHILCGAAHASSTLTHRGNRTTNHPNHRSFESRLDGSHRDSQLRARASHVADPHLASAVGTSLCTVRAAAATQISS